MSTSDRALPGRFSVPEPSSPPALPGKGALAAAIGAALAGPGQAVAQDQRMLEEIVVTAQRRAESLQDVAFSIQAFSEDDIRRQGLYNFEDYAKFIPSLSYVSSAPGLTNIVFRGVSGNDAGGGSITDSSAALYLDEMPLTQFNVQVDPRLVDIERIESLAGPQGTLYGDSSQSGTLRIITNKPDATAFSAFADTTLRTGSDSDESYEISGMVNLPLIQDKLAIRLVGFTARDGGYIDNVLGTSPTLGPDVTPARGLKTNDSTVGEDINQVDFAGGRIAARWTPDDQWAITGSFVFQNTEADGLTDYDPGVGDLKTVKFFEESREDKWWQGGLTIERSFGNVNFLSATSYFDRKIDYTIDRTEYAAYFNVLFCSYYATYCWSGLSNGDVTLVPGQGLDFDNPTPDDQDTTGYNTLNQENKRWTQEFRLTGDGSRYRWVAGVFFEHKEQEWFYRAYTPEFLSTLSYYYWSQVLYAPNPAGEPAWWFSNDDVDWDQWAVFGDFTYDLTEKWTVSVGARYFDAESERIYQVDKRFITADSWPQSTGKRKQQDDDIVPKVSVSYKFDDEKLAYALYSRGFRAGGVNRNRGDVERLVFPPQYEPDFLDNYEIGAKTRWLDGRLQVNATAFFMQWDDFQVELIDPSFGACEGDEDPNVDPCGQPFQFLVGNASSAEQLGLELSIRALIGERLDFGLDATFLQGELSEDFQIDPDRPPLPDGTDLPGVPDLKYSAYLEYTWPVQFVAGGSIFARVQYSYTDKMLNLLEPFPEAPPGETPNSPQREMDSYGIADFKVGLQTDRWELQGFVNNFTDERAELYWNTLNHHTYWGRNQLNTNRPREYGLRFFYRWGD